MRHFKYTAGRLFVNKVTFFTKSHPRRETHAQTGDHARPPPLSPMGRGQGSGQPPREKNHFIDNPFFPNILKKRRKCLTFLTTHKGNEVYSALVPLLLANVTRHPLSVSSEPERPASLHTTPRANGSPDLTQPPVRNEGGDG